MEFAWSIARQGRDGEIGRRSGLKIRRGESSVGVRFPLPAPLLLYQTRHTFSAGFTMGCPGLQEKASANSGMFTTTPLMR